MFMKDMLHLYINIHVYIIFYTREYCMIISMNIENTSLRLCMLLASKTSRSTTVLYGILMCQCSNNSISTSLHLQHPVLGIHFQEHVLYIIESSSFQTLELRIHTTLLEIILRP